MTATTDVRELKSALTTKINALEGMERDWKVDGANVDAGTAEQVALYRKTLAEGEELKALIESASTSAELKSWAGSAAGGSVAPDVAAGMHAAMSEREGKSLGQMFTESTEFKSLLASGSTTMPTPWHIETPDLSSYVGGRKDVSTFSAPVQTTRGFGTTQFDPIVPRAMRTARVRDLFPVASTNANLIDYFRVVGFGTSRLDLTSGARSVRERAAADGIAAPLGNTTTDTFGLKPKSNLTFESAQAPVRLIAHYEVAHRNVLADEPQLQATINNELLYGLRLVEDAQILSGSGTGEDLLGILNTPNIQVYAQANAAAAATETKADALRRAATKCILAYYPPTGYVMHPYDWESIELTKTTFGQYVLATNVAVGAQTQAWRQPVVESPAMTQGTALTGAWGLGAQLYDRAQASIRISESHADFFIRNAVAILAESRLALACKRPESFTRITFFPGALQ